MNGSKKRVGSIPSDQMPKSDDTRPADPFDQPASMLLIAYAKELHKQSAKPLSRHPNQELETRLLTCLKDIVASSDELKVLATLWHSGIRGIQQYSPSFSNNNALDILSSLYRTKEAFTKAYIIDNMLERDVVLDMTDNYVSYREHNDVVWPTVKKAICINPKIIVAMQALDDEWRRQHNSDEDATEEVPKKWGPPTIEPPIETPKKEIKIEILKPKKSSIDLSHHFLDDHLRKRIQLAADGKNAEARRTLCEMGLYTGPEAIDEAIFERNVILFYGPPGTGKTSAALAIAGHLDVALYSVSIDTVFGMYWGESEKNARKIFDEYRTVSADLSPKPVLLLDECDSLLRKRERTSNSSIRDSMANVVNILLQEIESFSGTLIMTTNDIDMIDPALHRRIDETIELSIPSKELQHKMWRHYLNFKMLGADLVNVDELVNAASLTGALIVKVLQRTARNLVIEHGANAILTTEDLLREMRAEFSIENIATHDIPATLSTQGAVWHTHRSYAPK